MEQNRSDIHLPEKSLQEIKHNFQHDQEAHDGIIFSLSGLDDFFDFIFSSSG
jgi:hypothetical protein